MKRFCKLFALLLALMLVLTACGGNAATAGAQVPSGSVEAVLQQLLRAIDQYFDED